MQMQNISNNFFAHSRAFSTSCLLSVFLSTSVKLCANWEGDVFEKAFCSYRHCIVLSQRLGNVTRFPSHLGSFRNQEDEKSIREGHRAWLCIAGVPPLSFFSQLSILRVKKSNESFIYWTDVTKVLFKKVNLLFDNS